MIVKHLNSDMWSGDTKALVALWMSMQE